MTSLLERKGSQNREGKRTGWETAKRSPQQQDHHHHGASWIEI